jgi:hypothetical protein
LFFHKVPTNRNITLTIIQDNPIIARPIAAYLSTPRPFSYFFSSPAAVTIRKPPYKQITKAIVARIPRIQLIAFLIVSRSEDQVNVCDQSHTRFVSALGFDQSVPPPAPPQPSVALA